LADSRNVNQKTYKKALEMLDEVKNDYISYGKDPKALATTVLYHVCIEENLGKTSQTKLAKAGDISVVTLRKRASDVLKFCRGRGYSALGRTK
jgi:transcription initiation factor TFIIIB Brf1 subunit/transcription initiation factor TFIIB